MYCIVKCAAGASNHPWHKYLNSHKGRFDFQMDLGHALISKGIKMDCPNIADLDDPKKRPPYMRKKDWIPCSCNRCFFCVQGLTHGIAHKPKYGRRRVSTDTVIIDHPTMPEKLSKYTNYCRVCYHAKRHQHPNKTAHEIKSKLCNKTTKGYPSCGYTFYVCKECWPEFNLVHDPSKYQVE